MSGYISKIERVCAPQRGSKLWVDLLLDKRSGIFFAQVNGERVRAKSKDEAVALVEKALSSVTQAAWREVILLRVSDRRDDEDRASTENGNPVYSTSCQFTYLRRERAVNPLKPKETIEREHRDDFELRVKDRRKHEAYFGHSAADKKKRADEVEVNLRQDRDALAHVSSVWNHFNEHTKEYEIPYSPEAWAGIKRIAQAIHETQIKLDAFATTATPAALRGLGANPLLCLPATKGKKVSG